MKEPETSQLPPPAPRISRARYRYFSSPPATLSLRLADLAAQIPEAARLPSFNPEHSVALSCEEIFTGPAPKLPLSRLAEIACEHVRIDGVEDSPIRLPVVQLALAYRFVNGRELLEEPQPEVAQRPKEEFTPKEQAPKVKEGPEGIEPREPSVSPIGETAAAEVKGSTAALPVAPTASAPPEAEASAPATEKAPAEEAKAGDPPPPSSSQQAPAKPENPPSAASESANPAQPEPIEPEVWRPITVFPIFRRKVAEPHVKPPVAPLRPVVEIRTPRAPFVPPEFSTKSAQEEPPKAEETPQKEIAAPAPGPEAILVETEHVPKFEPNRAVEIIDQDALQAVFMTEEILSVDRVVELCGGLPGINSCVLAHRAAVLASHNVPESIDLISLSAHALEMLAAMRQSAARMGVGAVPAVTIHAEKGPITFFHQNELCLLVMHKDRGFVPGVREKLQKVVEHLPQADPARAGESSRLAWAPKKAAS